MKRLAEHVDVLRQIARDGDLARVTFRSGVSFVGHPVVSTHIVRLTMGGVTRHAIRLSAIAAVSRIHSAASVAAERVRTKT